jgi:hypothetical protein
MGARCWVVNIATQGFEKKYASPQEGFLSGGDSLPFETCGLATWARLETEQYLTNTI